MAAWFETRGVAALLTIRVQDLILRSALLCASRRPHPEEAPTGPREARPDDKLHAVSKDEATGLKIIGCKTCAERKTAAARERRRRIGQGDLRSLHWAFVVEAVLAVFNDGGNGLQR